MDFDDKDWQVVHLPNGIELLPSEASGCINYQGEVWYRKHFTINEKNMLNGGYSISKALWVNQKFGLMVS